MKARLDPHLHAVVLDGVFVPNNDSVVFHPLARLDDADIADLLQVIRVRVVNLLVRRGIVEHRDELTLLDNADDAWSLHEIDKTPVFLLPTHSLLIWMRRRAIPEPEQRATPTPISAHAVALQSSQQPAP